MIATPSLAGDIYQRHNDRCHWRFMMRMLSADAATRQADQLFELYKTDQFAVLESPRDQVGPFKLLPSFDDFAYRIYPIQEVANV